MVPEAKFSIDSRSGRDHLRASKPLCCSLIREVVSDPWQASVQVKRRILTICTDGIMLAPHGNMKGEIV